MSSPPCSPVRTVAAAPHHIQENCTHTWTGTPTQTSNPHHEFAEFCAKGSLYNVLQRARQSTEASAQLGWQRRLGMALDAAVGLLYLHSLQPAIIHRDVKSPNLLVDKAWTVKVGGGGGGLVGSALGVLPGTRCRMSGAWWVCKRGC